jgi:hypothetical protein
MRLTLPTLGTLLVLAGASCRPAASNPDDGAASRSDTLGGRAAAVPQADTSTPSADIELRTDKTHYRAGDAVTMTFVNKSTATFDFNPCPRIIERQVGRDWIPVEEPLRMCTMEAWILKAHETRTAQTKLSSTIPPGPVRIVVALTKEGQSSSASGVHAISPTVTIDP